MNITFKLNKSSVEISLIDFQEVLKFQSILDETQKELQELKNNIEESETSEAQVNHLQSLVETQGREIEYEKEVNKKLKEQKELDSKAIETLKDELQEARNRLDSLEGDVAQMEEDNSELQDEKEEIEGEKEELENEKEELQERVDDLIYGEHVLEERVVALESEIDTFKERIKTLVEKANSLQDASDSNYKLFNNELVRNGLLESELENMKKIVLN